MLTFLLAMLAPAYAGEEGALAAIPFGVAHFMWGKPVRGIVYAGTQATGVTAATLGSVKAAEANENGDQDAVAQWQIVAGGGVALATTSFLIQCIDGSRLAEIRAGEQAINDVQLFDSAKRSALVELSLGSPEFVAPPWSPVVGRAAASPLWSPLIGPALVWPAVPSPAVASHAVASHAVPSPAVETLP